MVFTLRITVGFILLLIATNPLESASSWRQTRQIKSSVLTDSKNVSNTNNEADALKENNSKLVKKLVINETNKNDELLKKPKTETPILSDLDKQSSDVQISKNASSEISTTEEPEKIVTKNLDDDKIKDKFTREDSSRSIDFDIEKYTSPEFHNKNNVYTQPVSPDIEKYVNTDFGLTSTTEGSYSYSRYADYLSELTTPKHELFDLKHRQIEEGVQQNLDEINAHFPLNHETEKPPSVDVLLDKVNDTNVQLDYKSFKTINQSNTKDASSIHKDLLTQKGTKLFFNETYNETKVIDEQNTIPITGPDDHLSESSKDSSLEEKDNKKIIENESKLNPTLVEAISAKPVSDNEANANETLTKINEIGKSQKPTTDKPTVNLTKPPTLNKTSSLISNKIEVEKVKPIETDTIKLDVDASKRISNTVSPNLNATTYTDNKELNVKENQIFKTILPPLNNETTTDVAQTTKNVIASSKLLPEITTSRENETTTIDISTTTETTTVAAETTTLETNLAKNITEITSTVYQIVPKETTTELLPNDTTTETLPEETTTETVQNETTIATETSTQTLMPDDTTLAETTTEVITTTVTSNFEVSTTFSTTTDAVINNVISKAVEISNSSNSLPKESEVRVQQPYENDTNKINKNSTGEETINEFNREPTNVTDFDEESDEDYGEASPKTNNDIFKLPSTPTNIPLNKNYSNTNNNTIRKTVEISTTSFIDEEHSTTSENLELPPDDNDGKVIAIIISCVGAICLIALVVLLIIMRKRQKRFNYGQRCTPVSLDDYSMDNVSVYNSVRRKGVLRFSKRSYGNPAFDDPASTSNQLNFQALSKFASNAEEIRKEFDEIPQVTTRTNELPEGCETKNRYANVIPLPETRVFLNSIENYPNSDYINANYVTGHKSMRNYYIACQAPMQNTVEDFWRMIWEQQSKVILMLTHIFENGTEKCFDYLPPSEVTDCQRLFGDLQVVLKRREVKTKYIISSIQLKNMVSNSWREITHLWYIGWPEKGVPEEENSIITFLIEARSYLKIALNTGNNNYSLQSNDGTNGNSSNHPTISTSPMVIHCSPGTGRTGSVIACDIAIREFELTRQVDIPKIVYKIRRDRASSVQTRDQYAFIYKVISLYATKLTGGGLDSI